MNVQHTLRQGSRLVLSALLLAAGASAAAQETVEMAGKVPDAATIKQGLFPDDECEQLRQAGFKCMGFKPAVRFSLPAASFKVGSAELPDMLKRQLDAFADVLKARPANSKRVRVEGHADASGTADVNMELSRKRADTAKQYLVDKGVKAELLEAVGMGSSEPKVSSNPLAPENRRVVIGRESVASAN